MSFTGIEDLDILIILYSSISDINSLYLVNKLLNGLISQKSILQPIILKHNLSESTSFPQLYNKIILLRELEKTKVKRAFYCAAEIVPYLPTLKYFDLYVGSRVIWKNHNYRVISSNLSKSQKFVRRISMVKVDVYGNPIQIDVSGNKTGEEIIIAHLSKFTKYIWVGPDNNMSNPIVPGIVDIPPSLLPLMKSPRY